MTKQQKILGVVVALGVGAVGLDRFVLDAESSGPASASASAAVNQAAAVVVQTTAPTPDAGREPPAATPDEPETITGHPALSGRLDELASTQSLAVDGMIDAFVPRGEWAKAAPPAQAARDAKPFDQRHRLDAVMAASGGAVAIVDGRTLHPGNLYDGFVVRSIGEASVTFERDGERVTLHLAGAGAAR